MGVASTNTIAYKLVASGSILDLYNDEDILLSDNITGLFDIGTLPADFSRTIVLPATKKNNAFFEHVYDISIDSPYLFATNVKVDAYLDFDGIYLASGYLQLNRVTVKEGLGVESYEVSIYGSLSSFARDMNRYYLTDLDSLSIYNHTSSIANISASWHGNLFSGNIVYPLADYGKGFRFTPEEPYFGIDDSEGALHVQDFKPAIRVKKVWDAIFDKFGYTYSGSFWQQSYLDDVYLFLNNSLKYPEFPDVDLENYGVIKISAFSGSNQTSLNIPQSTVTNLPWFNVEKDNNNLLGTYSSYRMPVTSSIRGILNLEVQLSGSLGAPQINLYVRETGSLSNDSITTLVNFNNFFSQSVISSFAAGDSAQNQIYSIQTEFNTSLLDGGKTYYFGLEWVDQFAAPYNNFTFILDPNDKPKSYLRILELGNAADNKIMEIPRNMPYGTNGIRLIDFIKGLQKKFNLIIYPDKTKLNQFIVETFNDWYDSGEIKDFNKYINLKNPIEVIPANTLGVNQLSFGDSVDQDYVSQQFSKAENRPFGTAFYNDTTNFFSQGSLKVDTGLGVSPLVYLQGTGISGSIGGFPPPVEPCGVYDLGPAPFGQWVTWTNCDGSPGQAYLDTDNTYFGLCAKIGTVVGSLPITFIDNCDR